MNYLAQTEQTIGNTITGLGTYGTGGSTSPSLLTTALTAIIGVITLVAGIYFVFLLITGGIAWMSSGGDKGKLASAREKMFSGFIGLVIVVAAIFLAQILGSIIGLPNILDPVNTLLKISP